MQRAWNYLKDVLDKTISAIEVGMIITVESVFSKKRISHDYNQVKAIWT